MLPFNESKEAPDYDYALKLNATDEVNIAAFMMSAYIAAYDSPIIDIYFLRIDDYPVVLINAEDEDTIIEYAAKTAHILRAVKLTALLIPTFDSYADLKVNDEIEDNSVESDRFDTVKLYAVAKIEYYPPDIESFMNSVRPLILGDVPNEGMFDSAMIFLADNVWDYLDELLPNMMIAEASAADVEKMIENNDYAHLDKIIDIYKQSNKGKYMLKLFLIMSILKEYGDALK